MYVCIVKVINLSQSTIIVSGVDSWHMTRIGLISEAQYFADD